MTLLLPAADRVVREAVDAVLEGRTRPGSGSDVSFATRSSRYRVIHGVLREASDASLIGSRFVGWLFDAGREPTVSERWDTDARAVLIDESKGQIVVTSLTRVHVANAVPVLPETVVEANTGPGRSSDGFPARAGTLHGLPVVDPEPSQEISLSDVAAPPGPAAGAPPAPDAPTAAVPSPPQQTSPVPKRTIPPSPPIPGRQATPIPVGRPATPLMPMRPPTPPRSAPAPMALPPPAAVPHPGTRTAPMAAMSVKSQSGPPAPPSAPPVPPAPPRAPPRAASTHLGLAPATRFPPAPQEPIVLHEPLMTPNGPVDLSTLEEISAQLSVTGEISAAIMPPVAPPAPPRAAPPAAPPAVPRADASASETPAPRRDATASGAAASGEVPPAPETVPGWAGKSAPLPQFDLDDADLDLPTRADPLPPAPPSEEEAVIPLIPRN